MNSSGNVNSGPSIVWADFNEAVADVLYGESKAGLPVFALPSDDELVDIRDSLRVTESNPRAWFLQTVSNGPFMRQPDPLKSFAYLAGTRAPLETPPFLPVLCALAFAAEAMHADQEVAAHNYYGRLFEVLKVDKDQQTVFQKSYQKHGVALWDSLNEWLDEWEGERGLATAFAIGHKPYVGRALSQVLLRQIDRLKLPEFFVSEGLAPRTRLQSADLEAIMDPWMVKNPPYFSHALTHLWTDSTARQGVSSTVAIELEAWDGSGVESSDVAKSNRGRELRVIAQLRVFPRQQLRLDLLVPNIHPEQDSLDIFLEHSDSQSQLKLAQTVTGDWRLESPEAVSPESFVSDLIQLSVASPEITLTRRPRRITPLRYDELLGSFIEVERVQLGEPSLILAMNAATVRLDQFLMQHARGGYTKLGTECLGIPSGWSVYKDVEILRRPDGPVHADLQPLLPRSVSALAVSRGFSVPGRVRKWSSLQPPEVHAAASGVESLSIEVFQSGRSGTLMWEETCEGSAVILSLADLKLPDGDYLIRVRADDNKKAGASSVVRLRSGSAPAADSLKGRSDITHQPSSSTVWPLTASVVAGPERIDGLFVHVSPQQVTTLQVPPAQEWARRKKSETDKPQLRLGVSVAPDACLLTGAHRYELPEANPTKPQSASVEGECTTCGQIKRFPTTPWGASKKKKQKKKEPKEIASAVLETVPPIRSESDNSIRVAFDALCHVGGGDGSYFDRIAGQVDGGALFAKDFIRKLDSLGHIDVVRDTATGTVTRWEMTPRCLVPVDDDRFWLVGRQSLAMWNALAAAEDAECREACFGEEQVIPRFTIRQSAANSDALSEFLAQQNIAKFAVNPALDIAKALPPLSSMVSGLETQVAPPPMGTQRWDVDSATWSECRSLESPGAYRRGQYRRQYFVRSQEDLEQGTIRLCNVFTAKYLSHLWANKPLLGYHEKSQSVVVPLGANLPGLYGRALVAASGWTPRENLKAMLLQYRKVSTGLAEAVYSRLMS